MPCARDIVLAALRQGAVEGAPWDEKLGKLRGLDEYGLNIYMGE